MLKLLRLFGHPKYKLRKPAVNPKLLVNFVSLYAVQGATYILPLITIPYLGRVLGPGGWGAVLFAQAIGTFIAMAVEYGFDFSATREVARYPNDRQRLKELVTGVMSAKILLALAGLLIAFVVRPYTLRIAPSPALFWSSAIWGVGQGINMLWYFQGLQRMTWAGGLDITGKIIATASIFVLVRGPEDGWKVMMAQALGCAVSHAITVAMAYHEVGFCRPTFRLMAQALRVGWAMFLFRASMTLAGSANGLILGFFASPAAVGMFGGADKFRQLGFQALWPINQTLFPHQSERVKHDPRNGLRMVRGSLVVLGGFSVCFGVVLAVFAPVLVRLALGPAFLPAAPILRVFACMIPMQLMATVLCSQWMLPLGLDRQVTFVALSSGVCNAVLGIPLSIRFGAFGMAIAVTLSQVYALAALLVLLQRKGLSPVFGLRLPEKGISPEAGDAFAEPVSTVSNA